MKCKKCNKEGSTDAKFCNDCGTKFDSSITPKKSLSRKIGGFFSGLLAFFIVQRITVIMVTILLSSIFGASERSLRNIESAAQLLALILGVIAATKIYGFVSTKSNN